jgi:hypothetical protein
MKREKFLKEVAAICGSQEREAIHRLAGMPIGARHHAARKIGRGASDEALTEFLTALVDDDLIDDLAKIVPKPATHDEANELLKRLWARLLVMISPEARDVLNAHNQLRLMSQRVLQEAGPELEQGFERALENARAVLEATSTQEED